MKTYVIYRDRLSKKILNYSTSATDNNLDENIAKFNASDKSRTAEKVLDHDLISLIEMAEKNKSLRQSDLRDIEESINNLSNEFYCLKEAIK